MPSLSNDYGSGSNNDDANNSDANNYETLDIVAPLVILSMFIGICLFMCISDCVTKIKRNCKYQTNKPEDIKKNKLTQKCINRLNKKNKIDLDKESECSICIEPIVDSTKLIYLDCNHVFHKNCLQEWVKSQSKQDNTINCPLCRYTIINNYKIVYNHRESERDPESDTESLSDFLD